MIDANTAVFTALDDYCASDEPLNNAGSERYIQSTEADKVFLKNARLSDHVHFTKWMKIARFDLNGTAYFFTCGLDIADPPTQVRTEDMYGGHLTAFLSELAPTPRASFANVKNVVEIGDRRVPDYKGHDHRSILSLFPPIQFFSVPDLADEDSYKVFFLLCLLDRRLAQHWIDEPLARKLRSMAEMDSLSIPYQVLCRSVVDMDPSSMFLSLYRCLEAIYAHSHVRKLMAALDIDKPWGEVASLIERELSWRPKEDASLEALLANVGHDELRAVSKALSFDIPADAKTHQFVAKQIYELRNQTVHYRPIHKKHNARQPNWNCLCEAMADVVINAYGSISLC